MPTMAHSTVSQNGIRSRLPGAASLPRMPITTPPSSSQRIPPKVHVCPHLTSIGANVVIGAVMVTPSTSRTQEPRGARAGTRGGIPRRPVPRDAGRQTRGSAPEPDLADDAAADLDVGDVAGRHQDPAAPAVGEGEGAVLG